MLLERLKKKFNPQNENALLTILITISNIFKIEMEIRFYLMGNVWVFGPNVCRSSCPEMLSKKGVLKNFADFIGNIDVLV